MALMACVTGMCHWHVSPRNASLLSPRHGMFLIMPVTTDYFHWTNPHNYLHFQGHPVIQGPPLILNSLIMTIRRSALVQTDM